MIMSYRDWKISLVLVSFFLGLLLAVQFKTQRRTGTLPSSARAEELAEMLMVSEKERKLVEEDVKKLRQQLTEIEKQVVERKGVKESLLKELQELRMMAGITKIKGPGIIVVLEDSEQKALPTDDPNLFIVHYQDILSLVNELFSSGAEAVSVNGQRMMATSEIRCTGPTILINGTRLASPYEIAAVGDPLTLYNALSMRGGIVEALKQMSIKVHILKQNDLVIPAFTSSMRFKFARPVENGNNAQP